MTFAERAEKINRKYPFASSVPSDKKARDSELQELFEEQEFEKENRAAQEEARQMNPLFATPGPNNNKEELFVLGGDTLRNINEATAKLVGSDFNPGTGALPNEGGDFFNKILNSVGDFFGGDGNNLDSYLNIGSGLVSAGTNLLNRNSVSDPKLIKPTQFTPTTKFRGVNFEPIARNLQNQLETSKYQLSESGADFDTISAGLTKANDQLAGKSGEIKVQEQIANNTEAARVEEVVNRGLLYNTESMNQAKIDQAVRQDVADQKRRDYLDVLGESVAGILEQEGNRAYSKELEPFMEQIAKMEGLLKST